MTWKQHLRLRCSHVEQVLTINLRVQDSTSYNQEFTRLAHLERRTITLIIGISGRYVVIGQLKKYVQIVGNLLLSLIQSSALIQVILRLLNYK